MLHDAASYIESVARLTGAGAVILAIECLWCSREFRNGGLLEWSVCSFHKLPRALPQRLGWAYEPLMRWPGCLVLLVIHGVAGLTLLVYPKSDLARQVTLGVLSVTCLLWQVRSVAHATYGAEEIRTVVTLVLLLHSFGMQSQFVGAAALIFLALVTAMIYFGSGLLKLRQAAWRDGTALTRLLRVSVMGCPAAADLLERFPCAAKMATWGVLLFQLLFPLALSHQGVAIVFVVAGVLMHLGIGAVMGVNRFVWSMGSLYPAVWYVAGHFL